MPAPLSFYVTMGKRVRGAVFFFVGGANFELCCQLKKLFGA